MPNPFADRFTNALGRLEEHREVDPLAALFSNNCEVGNVIVPEKFHGTDGARIFWTKYRDTFEAMRSTFRNQIEADGRVALEWSTEGTLSDGKKVEYDGVSIIEIEDDRITRFRAYFDAGALGRQVSGE